MLLAWFQSELVPVVLHNSTISYCILLRFTVEYVNWPVASSNWEVILHYMVNQAAIKKACWLLDSH